MFRDTGLVPQSKIRAAFIEPMLLASTDALPDSDEWSYEVKLDGYLALDIKAGGQAQNPFTPIAPFLPSGIIQLKSSSEMAIYQ